jgi:hypothetical protein
VCLHASSALPSHSSVAMQTSRRWPMTATRITARPLGVRSHTRGSATIRVCPPVSCAGDRRGPRSIARSSAWLGRARDRRRRLRPGAVHPLHERGYDTIAGSIRDVSVTGYDIVCRFETLEHIADLNRVFEQLRRVLAHGGSVYVSVPNGEATTLQEEMTGFGTCHPTTWGVGIPLLSAALASGAGLPRSRSRLSHTHGRVRVGACRRQGERPVLHGGHSRPPDQRGRPPTGAPSPQASVGRGISSASPLDPRPIPAALMLGPLVPRSVCKRSAS